MHKSHRTNPWARVQDISAPLCPHFLPGPVIACLLARRISLKCFFQSLSVAPIFCFYFTLGSNPSDSLCSCLHHRVLQLFDSDER